MLLSLNFRWLFFLRDQDIINMEALTYVFID